MTSQTFRRAFAARQKLLVDWEGRAGRGPPADKLRTTALGSTSTELLSHVRGHQTRGVVLLHMEADELLQGREGVELV